MPDEDGHSLVRRLREGSASRGRAVPSIAVTAYARREDRARALAAGFVEHMGKPIDPDALIAAVARLAGRSVA
jgi:CheY-like chemotaxis protein